MVSRANKTVGVGGHIATYASAASLYEVGFNHFFRGKDLASGMGDQVYFQGHAAPGIYARAFLEGRLTDTHLDGFRQEMSHAPHGLSSYPHPRLMPQFWEFPTVSMGLGPIGAIYQARFNRYLDARGLADTSNSHVWAFLGDGEMDEVESLGAIGVASREELDNLTFVINCNLQRLDGPVRGNGKIIQELEAYFRGAGWNVIKVIWGRDWDPLLARDGDGVLVHQMNATPDGQYQTYTVESGAYIREHFFGGDPRLRKMVEGHSDDELRKLSRGGHDYRKVYAAFEAARNHVGQPTVILAKTIKGWTLESFEGRNATHQMKKLTKADLKAFRDRLYLPISDAALDADLPPYYHPGEKSDEIQYMKERRAELGGALPKRVVRAKPLEPARADDKVYAEFRAGSGKQQVATTMATVRLFKDLMKDKEIGRAVRPDHPGRGAHVRPRRDLPDREDLLAARAGVRGGRPRAAAVLQGVDHRADPARGHLRGRLDGLADRGRVVLRHARAADDPVLHLLLDVRLPAHRRPVLGARRPARPRLRTRARPPGARRSPARGCSTPTGTRRCSRRPTRPAWPTTRRGRTRSRTSSGPDSPRMYGIGAFDSRGVSDHDVFYYLTIYNEPVIQPREPEGLDVEALLRGMYRYSPALEGTGRPRAQLLASGVAMPWALDAQRMLGEEWGVDTDVWSVTSWNELRRDAVECEQHALMHPGTDAPVPFVASALADAPGPGHRGVGLHARRARPDLALGARRLHLARHRRLRLRRHPRRRPAVLPRRRPVDRGRHPRQARRRRRGQAGGPPRGLRALPPGQRHRGRRGPHRRRLLVLSQPRRFVFPSGVVAISTEIATTPLGKAQVSG